MDDGWRRWLEPRSESEGFDEANGYTQFISKPRHKGNDNILQRP